jgi:hypothetical protein
MADAPYLIALALLEQNGTRAMPLQGKSLRDPIPTGGDPGDEGRRQVLELLVRIWQRSDSGLLQRAAGSNSLLLAEVPIEALQLQLPQLKANWLTSKPCSWSWPRWPAGCGVSTKNHAQPWSSTRSGEPQAHAAEPATRQQCPLDAQKQNGRNWVWQAA